MLLNKIISQLNVKTNAMRKNPVLGIFGDSVPCFKPKTGQARRAVARAFWRPICQFGSPKSVPKIFLESKNVKVWYCV